MNHFWLVEVLSLRHYAHQTLEQRFSSIRRSGRHSIVVNRAAYKRACLSTFREKGCKVLRDGKGKAKLYAMILVGRKIVGRRLGQTERRLNFTHKPARQAASVRH